jgi:hypothetical protein
MFEAMDALHERSSGAIGVVLPPPVDGERLERWLLKVLCGGLFSGAFRIGPDTTMKGIDPPIEWLQILFGQARFTERQGLYYIAPAPGKTITTDPLVRDRSVEHMSDSRRSGLRRC